MDQARFMIQLVILHPLLTHPVAGSPEVRASVNAQRPWLDRAWKEWEQKVEMSWKDVKP